MASIHILPLVPQTVVTHHASYNSTRPEDQFDTFLQEIFDAMRGNYYVEPTKNGWPKSKQLTAVGRSHSR